MEAQLPSLIFAYNTNGHVPTIVVQENGIDLLNSHLPSQPVKKTELINEKRYCYHLTMISNNKNKRENKRAGPIDIQSNNNRQRYVTIHDFLLQLLSEMLKTKKYKNVYASMNLNHSLDIRRP